MKVVGKIVPLADKVLISSMNFDGQKTFLELSFLAIMEK